MMLLGYTKENIIIMTVKVPMLFGKNIDEIKIKKRFYEQLGIGDVIIDHPRYLIQNIELSFARYVFYRRIGIKIDRLNANLLFMKQEFFLKKYGKTNKQLIALYNYNEYLENKKNKTRKKIV